MKKLSILFIFLINFIFSQTGGGFGGGLPSFLKNASIMVGLNQSFYGEDYNDAIEDAGDMGTDVDENAFRKLNFTIMNEYDTGVLGGLKYLSYGYDLKATTTSFGGGDVDYLYIDTDIVETELELKFLKLFVTYPLNNGLYLGVEGGYFLEGEGKYKENNIEDDTETYDRDMWTDADFSEFDYGLLGQFFYKVNDNILATVEGYYGLSKFSEDNDFLYSGIPNVFHYVNLSIAYKLGKK